MSGIWCSSWQFSLSSALVSYSGGFFYCSCFKISLTYFYTFFLFIVLETYIWKLHLNLFYMVSHTQFDFFITSKTSFINYEVCISLADYWWVVYMCEVSRGKHVPYLWSAHACSSLYHIFCFPFPRLLLCQACLSLHLIVRVVNASFYIK